MSIFNRIKLGIFIPFQIPSIICHIFLIYHLIFNRQLRHALQNHVILIFLITNCLLITIDLSMAYYFLNNNLIKENNLNFCLAWNFINSFLSNLSVFLMMWASFERHLFIFYDRQIFNNKLKRFIFHYIPIIILIIYTLIFYFITIIISPFCSNIEHFDYNEVFCHRACYIHHVIILSSIDLLIHKILCSILIFSFSLFLLIRIVYKKKQRNQIIRWHRHKRMTIQIISISTLYFIGTLPSAIAESLHIFVKSDYDGGESMIQDELFLYLFYLTSLIIPFISLMSFSEVYQKLRFLLCLKRRTNTISKVTYSVRRNQVDIPVLNIKKSTIKPI
ncbi:unnamed protein product [Rotaria sordida]|uniref:G-protein coupled receptors family 1 profile domain-containing protein n=1 Tax=Rotaria sordida TaxID=392033 RepID=A0A819ZU47_9BILA|nr:unnamed protein product [Rotaria sordida]CAF4168261.1 unnamed protein product [Rotaria sordida]